jgi:hypothetical protein
MNAAVKKFGELADFFTGSSTERPHIHLPPLKNFTQSISQALFPPFELSAASIMTNLMMTFIMALILIIAYTGIAKYFSKFRNWFLNKPTTVGKDKIHPVRRPSMDKRKSNFEAKVNALVETRIEGIVEDWAKMSDEIQSGVELKINSMKEGFQGNIEEVISQLNVALEENSTRCLARRHEMVVEYAERFQIIHDQFAAVNQVGVATSNRCDELIRNISQIRTELDEVKGLLLSVQANKKSPEIGRSSNLEYQLGNSGRVIPTPIRLTPSHNTIEGREFGVQNKKDDSTQTEQNPPFAEDRILTVEERASLKNPHTTEVESSRYEDRILTVGDRVSFADENPHTTGIASSCYEDRILNGAGKTPEHNFVHSTPVHCVFKPVESLPITHVPSSIQHPFLPNTPIIFQSGGSIPMPKFNSKLETAEHFLSELEMYMRRKRCPPEDWTLMLSPIFNQDPDQSLWWKRARMVAKTWELFKEHFRAFYGSESDRCSALEKLLLRRQRENETFQTFAFEMDLMYRKVYNLSSDVNVKEVLTFISERALPTLKPHLLAFQAKDLYALVLYGSKIEVPQSAKSDVKKTFSGSKWGNKENPTNKETSPKPVISEPNAVEKPPNNTWKKVEGNKEFPKPKCTFCTKYGHTAENCRSRIQVKKASPLTKEVTPSVDPPKPVDKQGKGEGA